MKQVEGIVCKRAWLISGLLSFLLLVGLSYGIRPQDLDADGDGMSDDYEIFYGLNPTNPADAAWDYDEDVLSNLGESRILTDPFSADTDFDGWRDDSDAVPISRAWLPFGAPLFTHGDFCEYAQPDWLLGGAWKVGGEWITNPPAWRVAGSESNGGAGLFIAVDRNILTNNLRFAIHFEGRAGQPVPPSNSVEQSGSGGWPALFIALLDTNGLVVVADLYGNLLSGSNVAEVVLLDVPTALFPDAAIIQLRHGGGEVLVLEGLVYISEDGDELDADQERQLGTSDYAIDSNGNGISDYAEWFATAGGGSSTNNPGGGSGGDGSGEEDNGQQSNGTVWVDQAIGDDDDFTGHAPTVAGRNGPKKTIRRGLAALEQDGAHTLIINSGHYGEDLDLCGKGGVKVRIAGNVRL